MSRATIDDAVEALRRGLVVVIPTDTVYGLAADPTRAGATARLFEAKVRPMHVQVPVLVDSVEQADAIGILDGRARTLMDRFWPGGLTVVVQRRPGVELDLGDDTGTVGVRCPDHPVARLLCAEVAPLATTSANLHGGATPATATEVADLFGDAVAVVVDGGRCDRRSSTVVDCTGTDVVLLREGTVAWSDVIGVAG